MRDSTRGNACSQSSASGSTSGSASTSLPVDSVTQNPAQVPNHSSAGLVEPRTPRYDRAAQGAGPSVVASVSRQMPVLTLNVNPPSDDFCPPSPTVRPEKTVHRQTTAVSTSFISDLSFTNLAG